MQYHVRIALTKPEHPHKSFRMSHVLLLQRVTKPSINEVYQKKGTRCKRKKNPSDPDAVVTADAGAVLVAEAGVAPAVF